MVQTRSASKKASLSPPTAAAEAGKPSKLPPGTTYWGKLYLNVRKRGRQFSTAVALYGIALIAGCVYLNYQYKQQDPSFAFTEFPLLSPALRPKLSFTIFPALVVNAAALLVSTTIPSLALTEQKDLPTANANMTVIRKLVERANVSRLVTNVFAVLFLWRMSTFYPKINSGSWEDMEWFKYSTAMGGLGLLIGLANIYIYSELTKAAQLQRKQYRLMFVEK